MPINKIWFKNIFNILQRYEPTHVSKYILSEMCKNALFYLATACKWDYVEELLNFGGIFEAKYFLKTVH